MLGGSQTAGGLQTLGVVHAKNNIQIRPVQLARAASRRGTPISTSTPRTAIQRTTATTTSPYCAVPRQAAIAISCSPHNGGFCSQHITMMLARINRYASDRRAAEQLRRKLMAMRERDVDPSGVARGLPPLAAVERA